MEEIGKDGVCKRKFGRPRAFFFWIQHFYSTTSKLVLRHGGLQKSPMSGEYLQGKGVWCGRSSIVEGEDCSVFKGDVMAVMRRQ